MYSESSSDIHNYFFKDEVKEYETASIFEYDVIKSSDTSKGNVVAEKVNVDETFKEIGIITYDVLLHFTYSGNYEFNNLSEKVSSFENYEFYVNNKIKNVIAKGITEKTNYFCSFIETSEINIHSNNENMGTVLCTDNNMIRRRITNNFNDKDNFIIVNINPKEGYKFSKFSLVDNDFTSIGLITLDYEPLDENSFIIKNYAELKQYSCLPITVEFVEDNELIIDLDKEQDQSSFSVNNRTLKLLELKGDGDANSTTDIKFNTSLNLLGGGELILLK